MKWAKDVVHYIQGSVLYDSVLQRSLREHPSNSSITHFMGSKLILTLSTGSLSVTAWLYADARIRGLKSDTSDGFSFAHSSEIRSSNASSYVCGRKKGVALLPIQL
jgi:hypothetical protein